MKNERDRLKGPPLRNPGIRLFSKVLRVLDEESMSSFVLQDVIRLIICYIRSPNLGHELFQVSKKEGKGGSGLIHLVQKACSVYFQGTNAWGLRHKQS